MPAPRADCACDRRVRRGCAAGTLSGDSAGNLTQASARAAGAKTTAADDTGGSGCAAAAFRQPWSEGGVPGPSGRRTSGSGAGAGAVTEARRGIRSLGTWSGRRPALEGDVSQQRPRTARSHRRPACMGVGGFDQGPLPAVNRIGRHAEIFFPVGKFPHRGKGPKENNSVAHDGRERAGCILCGTPPCAGQPSGIMPFCPGWSRQFNRTGCGGNFFPLGISYRQIIPARSEK